MCNQTKTIKTHKSSLMEKTFTTYLCRFRAKEYFTKKKYFKPVAIFLLAAFLNMIAGCYYYKLQKYDAPSVNKLDLLNDQQRIFIIDIGDKVFWLRGLTINQEKSELTGTLAPMPDRIMKYYPSASSGVTRYKIEDKIILQVVHIHALEYAELDSSQILIPLKSINKIEVYDPAHDATTASFVFSTIGIIAVGIILIALISFITKGISCPFIYTFDGHDYTFSGEIFSGATQPGLERHDYLMLKNIKPFEEKYLLKVTNEIREIQHINLLELMVIDHPENIQVLMDKYGQPQTFTNPAPPIIAKNSDGTDILHIISKKDSLVYHGDEEAYENIPLSIADLTFEKPTEASKAKLIIRAKNSFWLENVFKGFHDMFGRKYESFSNSQEKVSGKELKDWTLKQNLPLSVYLSKDGTWIKQDYFEIAGPMALKDDILPINLEGVEGNTVNVRLETGFLFWEIDYVAMDFSEDVPVKITPVTVETAIDEKGKDVSREISANDKLYYMQPEVGNEATLTFPVPEFRDESRTLILHSKGFYKIIRESKGKPDRATLKTFRQPGRLPQYSKELYEQLMNITENRQ
jgi:hypothetical protein